MYENVDWTKTIHRLSANRIGSFMARGKWFEECDSITLSNTELLNLPTRDGMARVRIPGAFVRKFPIPVHRNYAVSHQPLWGSNAGLTDCVSSVQTLRFPIHITWTEEDITYCTFLIQRTLKAKREMAFPPCVVGCYLFVRQEVSGSHKSKRFDLRWTNLERTPRTTSSTATTVLTSLANSSQKITRKTHHVVINDEDATFAAYICR